MNLSIDCNAIKNANITIVIEKYQLKFILNADKTTFAIVEYVSITRKCEYELFYQNYSE